MDKPTLITMIFNTQQDLHHTVKESKEEKEAFEYLQQCESELFNAIKKQPKLRELAEEYNQAYMYYVIAKEEAAYYHGFKTAFLIMKEISLPEI